MAFESMRANDDPVRRRMPSASGPSTPGSTSLTAVAAAVAFGTASSSHGSQSSHASVASHASASAAAVASPASATSFGGNGLGLVGMPPINIVQASSTPVTPSMDAMTPPHPPAALSHGSPRSAAAHPSTSAHSSHESLPQHKPPLSVPLSVPPPRNPQQSTSPRNPPPPRPPSSILHTQIQLQQQQQQQQQQQKHQELPQSHASPPQVRRKSLHQPQQQPQYPQPLQRPAQISAASDTRPKSAALSDVSDPFADAHLVQPGSARNSAAYESDAAFHTNDTSQSYDSSSSSDSSDSGSPDPQETPPSMSPPRPRRSPPLVSRNSQRSHASSPGLLDHTIQSMIEPDHHIPSPSGGQFPSTLTSAPSPLGQLSASRNGPSGLGSPDRQLPPPPSRPSHAVNRSPISFPEARKLAALAPAPGMEPTSSSGSIPGGSGGAVDGIAVPKPPLPPRPGPNTRGASPEKLGEGVAPPPLPSRPSVRRTTYGLETSLSAPLLDDASLTMTPRDAPAGGSATLGRYAGLIAKETFHIPITRHTDRSAPVAESLPNTDVFHKGNVRSFAFSGFYAATGQQSARVWYIPSGENTRSVNPSTTEQRVHAVAFVPSRHLEHDSRTVWASIDRGELLEIDVETGDVVERRAIHNATVTHILRHRFSLYTLDENGSFKIWAPVDGRISLSATRPRALRISSSASRAPCSAALVDGDRLWTAFGKQLTVYNLAEDASVLVERRMDFGLAVGAVSCIAALPQRGQVYTAHEDGKITVFAAASLDKLRTYQVAFYRITSLVGVGDTCLWAGFGTGKIAVYDTAGGGGGVGVGVSVNGSSGGSGSGGQGLLVQIGSASDVAETSAHGASASSSASTGDAWVVVKEFTAYHNSAVTQLVVDDTSLALMGKLHVASVSDGGHMRFWDGMLSRHRLERGMRSRQTEYCDFDPVNVVMLTWNIDSRKPADMDAGDAEDKRFLHTLMATNADAEMFVFGFQELVDLESKSETAKHLFKKKGTKSSQTSLDQRQKLWQERLSRGLAEALPQNAYTLLECRQLVGLFQCIFVRSALAASISDVAVSMVKTGLGGYHGNKGGISTRFLWNDTSLCFVNCHLAAHQNQTSARNNDIANILKETAFGRVAGEGIWARGGDGTGIIDHELIFWSGDLNYRIDLPRSTVFDKIEANDGKHSGYVVCVGCCPLSACPSLRLSG
ncbi:hypothetical protein BC831DRAFT_55629 [Entophlyctis helioformis]|nr:hypothetical protein BC831DRAFT_55629 [Entophlyctis helioformis]